MQKEKVITRLAPSPTGLFHLGTARTALFNYLFAKANGGKFILRFEDTDRARSKPEYEKDILEGLKWLGLKWDEIKISKSQAQMPNKIPSSNAKYKNTFYRQSENLKIYQKYAEKLLKENKAYKKDRAIWFKISHQPSAISNQQIEYNDLIHGKIEFNLEEFNDFVIIKKDGLPTFMFSNIIDDHQMGITHVIRGDDHITNTPQQILIYQALGWQPPQFAHIPLILNKDRSKMSKRKDPVSVTRDFRDNGYLAEAMINYMALLGWNPKNDREFFTLVELIKEFDLKNINKSGAIFDIEKLNYFNNHYINKLPDDDLLTKILKLKTKNHNLKLKTDKDFLLKIIAIIRPRMNKLSDFNELTHYFFKLPKYNPGLLIFKKSTREVTLKGLNLTTYNLRLITKTQWVKIDDLNKLLSRTVLQGKFANGDVFWPIRVALSGLEKSPSPAEILWVLGKEESLRRIKLAMEKLQRKDKDE